MNISVVSGASGGIGQAIVENLLERGDVVVGIDRVGATLASENYAHQCFDVGCEDDARQCISELIGTYGKIDNLVNCAAIIGIRRPLWEVPTEDFESIVSNNLFTTFWMCKSVCPHMIEQGYGRIVNFGAIAGKDGSALSSHYASSKAAIIALTKALGKELASTENVLCNCVAPAAVDTEALRAHSDADIASHLGKIPKGRFCQPHEVAELVSWLTSAKCSFSTGAVYDISGGRATY